MAIDLLIGTKQRGRSFAQAEGDIFIEDLSNLLEKKDANELQLPALCNRIRVTDKGQEICPQVAHLIKDVVNAQKKPYPFVFCCWAGAKILVIPIPDTTYFAFCRSPGLQVHDRRLRHIERLCGIPFNESKRNWLKLLPFGVDFVRDATAKLKEQMGVEIPEEVGSELETLGEAYGHYEFDRIISDTTEEISVWNGHHYGMLKIDFASKPKGTVVVRVVTEELAAREVPWHTPIIGLVAYKKRKRSLGQALESVRLKTLSRALLPSNLVLYNNFESSGNGLWKANVSVYLEEGQKPHKEWWQTVVRQTYAGLDVGGGTVCTRLLEELDRWDFEHFKDEFFLPRAKRVVRSLRPAKPGSLYYFVFGDIAHGLMHGGSDNTRGLGSIKHLTTELMKMIKPYPLLTVYPQEQAKTSNRDMLLQDLVSGSFDYVTATRRDLFPLELAHRQYDPVFVENLLDQYPDFTVETLLEAITDQKISLGESPGREAWQTVIQYYYRKREKDLVRLEERLFELDASQQHQTLLSFRADLAGVLLKTISFGAIDGYLTIEHVRKKAYRNYVWGRLRVGK